MVLKRKEAILGLISDEILDLAGKVDGIRVNRKKPAATETDKKRWKAQLDALREIREEIADMHVTMV